MKILVIALDNQFPGNEGGSSHIEGVVGAFNDLGHEVILMVRRGKNQEKMEWMNNGKLMIRRFWFPKNKWKHLLYYTYIKNWVGYYSLFKGVQLVYERCKMFGNYGMFYGKIYGKKCILEMNEPIIGMPIVNQTMTENSTLYRAMVKWHKFFANMADVVTVTHESMTEGIKPKKVLKITYGVNPEQFNPKLGGEEYQKGFQLTPGKTVIYSGSFMKWHALPQLMKAAKIVCKQEPRAKFLMVGTGELLEECEKFVEDNELYHNFIFLKNVAHKEMPKLINAADIGIAVFDRLNPKFQKFHYYYSPMKVHEYKACGKPIIASNFGNLVELVKDGVNGFAIDELSEGELADAILNLMGNPELQMRIGKINREEAETTYNWKTIMAGVLNKLEELK